VGICPWTRHTPRNGEVSNCVLTEGELALGASPLQPDTAERECKHALTPWKGEAEGMAMRGHDTAL
jgi:hypothetical protein